jgi:very-short-patch-repair endonuclease
MEISMGSRLMQLTTSAEQAISMIKASEVIRFANREVMTAIENVLDTIVAELSAGSLPLAGRD